MATPDDLVRIHDLRERVYCRELRQFPFVSEDNPDSVFIAAVDRRNHRLLGAVAVTPPWKQFRASRYFAEDAVSAACDDGTFEIRTLTVEPERRMSRVMSALGYAAVEYGARRGASSFLAMAISTSVGTYRKAGFERTGHAARVGETEYHLMFARASETLRKVAERYQKGLVSNVQWDIPGPAVGATHGNSSGSGDVVACDVLDAWFQPPPPVLAASAGARPDKTPETGGWTLARTIEMSRGVLPGSVLVGCGSSELIHLLFRVLRGTVKLEPETYSEYAHAARLGGCEVTDAEDAGIFVFVNPNNPTGRTQSAAALVDFADARPGSWVVVDETYSEYLGGAASVERFHRANVVVVKSLSKCWALSGLRVGYLVCNDPGLAARLREAQMPWSVSNAASEAAAAAISEGCKPYYRQRWLETHSERAALVSELRARNVRVTPGAANWVVLPDATGADLSEWNRPGGIRARPLPNGGGARITVIPKHRQRIVRTVAPPLLPGRKNPCRPGGAGSGRSQRASRGMRGRPPSRTNSVDVPRFMS